MLFTIIASAQTKISTNLGDFSTLKVYNGIEVEIIKSDEQKIEITGEKSEKVKVKNVNGTLKISLNFPEVSADGKAIAKIFYKNNLDVIDANEGATITGKNINQDKLEVNAQEKAFINLTTTVISLKVRASSGGSIKLTGKATTQEVDLDLYGIYTGFAMEVSDETTVFAGTGAKAEVNPGKKLTAKVNFGGSIFYKGDTQLVEESKVAGGIIKKRN